ncbi:phospho-N-acetylmuramoyl-pentapeptide-transferase [Coxiella endosymbiont of Amblyomma americanum]|uniref:phospho-N-acetylmuramoyl-pentapeptide- transferase n=1 Tax=Coxiella endosymbiont of Amblyomma americanum TaxID=325775 RepID=UPI00057F3CC3|nr:phospho-N-acetylmuramoyl-pentapeptide-transferase [Coxiella endosymbiont of Amblyomma americanum]AJC50391.1 phospho-N-acetylmuramoyl-pentapeptide-transferase [Coxiella endosymbiont of Amblyomma americanum]AUJ58732.1 phospho-N-acetylmuramoyl-pentapeptide-transferase [Coxiella-like endosymbiont of Amblyomma americanum]
MFLWLIRFLHYHFNDCCVFNCVIFRSIVSGLTALVITFISCPYLIEKFKKLQINQTIRDSGPQTHSKKSGTPTMGGILIILAIMISTVLWGNLTNRFIWIILLIAIIFGSIGCVDDYYKVIKKNSSNGLSIRLKYLLQSLASFVAAIYFYLTSTSPSDTQLIVPFLKNVSFHLGFLYIFLVYFVVIGSSNAVNLTDGLDGLALMPVIMISGALGVFAYSSGNRVFAEYVSIPYIPGIDEIVVFCSALVGGGLGFLWYNAYPAQVFMGDVGSLGLGAALGVIAVLLLQEIVYFFMSGVFVFETLSVIIQVGYFKLSGGNRAFRMAPLHHHFELKGLSEPKIIIRFWIITFILVIFGLTTLKLR